MRMVERKQDSMNDAFLFSLMQKQLEEEGEIDELTMDVVKAPRIQGDESLSNLANRIVDEVKTVSAQQSLANKVLEQAGIDTSLGAAQPKVVNGHLKHVGQRARKLARRENSTRRVRRVKTRTSPSQLNVNATFSAAKAKSAPPSNTKSRPAIGSEDEVRKSARGKSNKRGKVFQRGKKASKSNGKRELNPDNTINFTI
ncbi:MAG: hypothetical protein NZ736_03980, partial [Candidatus Poseidoniaceae archaeon]|nr:hypothetical protein [Candidatus Poseidoniaceae archaeon]